jgi:toxin FitB
VSKILLDTNVISELMRPRPSAQVTAWFGQQDNTAFFVSSVARAEVLLGIALLPVGKRRSTFAALADKVFNEDLAHSSLPFDDYCATEYAFLVAARSAQGHPISTEDAQIAAIALVHRMALVTRNVKDFVGINGLTVLNPWASH